MSVGGATAGGATVRVPAWATGWGPSLVAFAAVRAFLLVAAAGHGADPRSVATWARWDSFRYLSIAVDGYYSQTSDGHNSRRPVGTEVGNAGWLPGYPLLVRAGRAVGLPVYATGCWLSAGFALGMLRAIDALVPAEVPRGRRVWVLLVAAFWPGFVYDHAIFPVSMATLLLAVAARLTAGGRWTAGGLAGAGASLSYTSGYTIGPVMGAWAVLGGTGVGVAVRRAVAMVGPALLPVAAFAGVLVWQRAVIGRWTALFEVHGQFHHAGLHPLAELGHLLWLGTWADRPLGRAMWQVPAVTAVWAAAVVPVAVGWRRRSAVDQLLAVAATAYWWGALSVGTAQNPWRAMAVTAAFLPPLCRRWPGPALWAVVAIFVGLGWVMCGCFLDESAI